MSTTPTTQRPRIRAGQPSEGTGSAQRINRTTPLAGEALQLHRGVFARVDTSRMPQDAGASVGQAMLGTAMPACGVNGNCYRQSTCGDHYCPGHPVNNPPTRPARHHAEPVVEVDHALRARVWRGVLASMAVMAALIVWAGWALLA